ncbi:MAG: hypothetical protein FD123_70 [Bacteroidetes bacterium]|nr:MAG: hypothetical protein FD123_70 [Bacteroidota bacterium]
MQNYTFRFSVLLSALAAGLLFSCSNEPETDRVLRSFPSPLPEILKNDSAAFRGIGLGMNVNAVKQRCNPKTLTLGEADNLLYEDSLAGKTSFTYEFNFDSLGLKEIQVDIYQRDSADAELMFGRFMDYFSRIYGQPESVQEFRRWKVPGQMRPTAIILKDESAEYGYGKLALTVYDTDMTDVIFIEGGEFQMGTPEDSLGRDSVRVF